jgi:two-component sensor histidine kinase
MRDIDAQLIHEMQNTALVLSAASARLNDERESLSPAAVAHLTEMMTRRSDMLVRLLRDLSTSHLAERGELDLSLQGVAWQDICEDVLTAQEPVERTRIRLDVAEDSVVVADPVRMTQVLDNLVTNALRYGGDHIVVSADRQGAVVRLTVSDDGPGVPDELLGTLFEAYAHGASSHALGGSGLGLLIVRQLCEAMNGTIEYNGSAGTQFIATLPALPAPSVPLGADVAKAGHSVVLWETDQGLVETLVNYVAHGLAAGHAVMVAAESAHLVQLDTALRDIGIDPASATASGQYLTLDADALHTYLQQQHHIDRERFEELVAQAVEDTKSRWRGLRVYGEIVDLYWRRRDDHLAIELEGCWNQLRARHAFPLLCGYHLGAHESAGAICDCHDLVVSA